MLVGLCGCGHDECNLYVYQSQFNYDTHFDQITPSGILIDTSGQNIDLVEIDQEVAELESCLSDFRVLPKEADCIATTFEFPNRNCLRVKIANDWFWSKDGTQQLLPSAAPIELCRAKGLTDDECWWRGGIQDGNVIITTPNLVIFKDPLIRVITGCNLSWSGGLEKCANK